MFDTCYMQLPASVPPARPFFLCFLACCLFLLFCLFFVWFGSFAFVCLVVSLLVVGPSWWLCLLVVVVVLFLVCFALCLKLGRCIVLDSLYCDMSFDATSATAASCVQLHVAVRSL